MTLEDRKYSIQMASNISGVGVHTIRAWEKRYKAIEPQRDDSGRRIYAQKEIERLILLSELCKLGNSIGHIANLATDDLKEIIKKYDKSVTLEQLLDGPIDTSINITQTLNNLILALHHYKLDIISHELEKIKILLSPRQFTIDILSPLLSEINRLVMKKQLTLTQEHAFSCLLRFHIGHMLYRGIQSKYKSEYTIAIATPEKELHEFGILMAALLCCHYKINFYYLGPNLPASALCEATKSIKADIIILGTTQTLNDYGLTYLDDYLAEILSMMDKDFNLWVGGPAHFSYTKFNRLKNFKYIPSIIMLDEILKDGTGQG